MRNKKVVKYLIAALVVLTTIIFISGCSIDIEKLMEGGQNNNKELVVKFIDVGQADSILIKTPSQKFILIDGGSNSGSQDLVNYLKKQGVKTIDVLIGTHPHEDHIGGIDDIIYSFDIESFYMPKVTTNTNTFKDVLAAAKKKGLKINTAKSGVPINIDDGIDIKMVAPISNKYESLNNYSGVLKMSYGKVSFLFTGDAEKISENEMLDNNVDLKSTVLKVGHHGSNTSTTNKFLNSVGPKYAVISCGKGNDYGHPHKEVINRLNKKGANIYRTDKDGTIVIATDGDTIKVTKDK